jgi:hypothetical protein
MKGFSIAFAVLVLCALIVAQNTQDQTQHVSSYQTYVFMQASPTPKDHKGSEIFQKITNDIEKFLHDNRVNMSGDPSGMNSRSETEVPLATVLDNAKKAGAAAVLYSKIEVPGKSIGVTTTAYALDGNKIWETTAGCDLDNNVSVDVCMKVTMETLYEALKYRIKEQDLPVIAAQNAVPNKQQ